MIFCNQNRDQVKNFVEFFIVPAKDIPVINGENPEWMKQLIECWERDVVQKFDEDRHDFYMDLLDLISRKAL